MKKFALTGSAVGHSKSPELFALAYRRMPGYSYELLPAQSVEEAMHLFDAHNLSGMNVTNPFKAAILSMADEQSEDVRNIGVANTIVLRNGKLCAYNTDVNGVIDSLQQIIRLENENVIVLGAGGAGRAAVYALKQAGSNVYWVNRTVEKLEQLSKTYGVNVLPVALVAEKLAISRVVVNTLPCGATVLNELILQRSHIILDADYAGKPLLKPAEKAGAIYIDGLSWLLYQAIPAFRIFTGIEPDIPAMQTIIRV